MFWDNNNSETSNNKSLGQEWQWQFVAEPLDVSNSPGLLCALKVGMLEDAGSEEWIDAVKKCVRDIAVPPSFSEIDGAEDAEKNVEDKAKEDKVDFSCRTWLLVALHELANGGFIGMVPDMNKIARTVERESRQLARDAEILDVGMVTVSEMYAE